MATGAASNDPVFWAIHPFFDKSWHMLLNQQLSFDIDLSWTDGSCYGSGWDDYLPFSNLLDSVNLKTKENFEGFYTNEDLWLHMSILNDNLPYIYQDFEVWGSCDWNPLEGNKL